MGSASRDGSNAPINEKFMKEKLYVIKIGGNVIDDEEKLSSFLRSFAALNHKKILIHGGGTLATSLAKDLNIPQQQVDGRRITDEATLRVVTMVYAGLINKKIVADLQSLQCNALGLCGADGNILRAHKRPAISAGVDYGYVGDVDTVSLDAIQKLLTGFDTLVFAPITHDGKGQLLNTNADTIAKEIAIGMSSLYDSTLIYCFEKNGVLMEKEEEDSVIRMIDSVYYQELLSAKNKKGEPVIADGMLPKLSNAFATIESGVGSVVIGHALDLEKIVEGEAGTRIRL
jgi:acetylglutamate kinase